MVAVDDESRWLSETDLATGPQRRHLSAVRGARLYDVETDADIAPALSAVDAVIRDLRPRELRAIDEDVAPHASEANESDEPSDAAEPDTEALLEELSAARGVRQRVEIDDESLAEEVLAADRAETPHTPALWDDPPAAHPAGRLEEATDDTVVKVAPRASSSEEPAHQCPELGRDRLRRPQRPVVAWPAQSG